MTKDFRGYTYEILISKAAFKKRGTFVHTRSAKILEDKMEKK
jgi:hypothetical protein